MNSATVESLDLLYNTMFDTHEFNSSDTDQNDELFKFVINNIRLSEEGRIVVPALWLESVKHLLPDNYKLASSILKSVLRKYRNDESKLNQYNESISKLIDNKIVELSLIHI